MKSVVSFSVLALALLIQSTMAKAFELSSGKQQVTLLELYTSEGCSSCPPADRWLSGLENDPRLWRELVPVSFHVDYWDWIGWNDRFAQARFSARQQRHIEQGHARVVYTPGFFVNGQEWRGFFERAPISITALPASELSIRLIDQNLSVTFDSTPAGGSALTVHVALLGMGLDTEVQAGENRGRTLQHDFVVLSLDSRALMADADTLQAELPLPQLSQAQAIAAWVTEDDSLRPLQAVGGFVQ